MRRHSDAGLLLAVTAAAFTSAAQAADLEFKAPPPAPVAAYSWTGRYVDLGNTTVSAFPLAPNPPFMVQNSVKTSGDIVRVGLNYQFGAR